MKHILSNSFPHSSHTNSNIGMLLTLAATTARTASRPRQFRRRSENA
jgi:hypothetical protein